MFRNRTLFFAALFACVPPFTLWAQSADRFQRLDLDRNGTIERNEWHGNSRAFNRLDRDRDGRISSDEYEYRAAARPRRARGDRFSSLDKNMSNRLENWEWPYNSQVFDELDSNHDASISRAEFDNLASVSLKQLDTNNDGTISESEWPGGFATFDQLDQDGDGTLIAREYLTRGTGWQKEQRFRAWDTNRNGVLEGTEWRSENRLFHLLDRNFDSVLSQDEFMDRDRGLFLSELDTNNDRVLSRNEWRGSAESFSQLDADRNGVVDAQEFFYRGTAWDRQQRFNLMDTNRDGRIQGNEWHGNRAALHSADRDGNGVLTVDEFLSSGAVYAD
ncbi:MAG: hypothetical protein IT158_24900 [Bryobacterales bacterium]|nr:hypothetical protein [Bryobacterales bacterium]